MDVENHRCKLDHKVNHHQCKGLVPVGYKFVPTDEELVLHYLVKKVFSKPLPPHVIQDIDAKELYSKPPANLDTNLSKKEYFFFINQTGYFGDESNPVRIVADGKGHWRSQGEETLKYNSNGVIITLKSTWTYYTGHPPYGKRTHWVMDEYQLQNTMKPGLQMKQWAIGRLKRGKQYDNCF
ncbi:NAC domain [Macleaya cordata]|uniref:NAC domain n=1 Tax=Macleaya cordata TaxID=56857 RepID=A0A200QIU5_MACCD|nr:NAC domain [Macleaya cordata]